MAHAGRHAYVCLGGKIPQRIFAGLRPEVRRPVARPSWIRQTGRTVELRAGLFQAPGTSVVFARPAVTRVRLIGDPDGAGGSIRGTAAAVSVNGVSVTGWDAAVGAPAEESRDRPYVYYTHSSSVRARSTTFSHPGRPATGGEGVTLGAGTTGTITGATFSHCRTGPSLRSSAVTVSGGGARDNTDDGLVVKAAALVSIERFTAVGNLDTAWSSDRRGARG